MKKSCLSVVFCIVCFLLQSQLVCSKTLTAEEIRAHQKEFEKFMARGVSAPPLSQTVSFDTYNPMALEQKKYYGFSVDCFFGALTVMEKNGEYNKKNPIPLFRKTMKGLENNEFERETLDVILFYFSRLALDDPSVIQSYQEEFLRSEGLSHSSLMKVLWYAHENRMQQFIRTRFQQASSQEEKESYRELIRNKKFAEIDVDTMPIRDCRDIELLWAEYFVTKNMRAIERIADQVTNNSPDIQKTIIRVEASSSLAQRGGWFEAVKAHCQSRVGSDASGENTWINLIEEMKPLDQGDEIVRCPIGRVPLFGTNGRAMACGAIYPKMDNARPNVLAPYVVECGNILHTRKLLNDWWGITGRYELLTNLEWLLDRGHRGGFNDRVKQVLRLNEQEQAKFISHQPESTRPQWKVVCKYGKQLGKKSILAWDFSRIVLLARFGYEAQYLTPAETCRLAVPVAVELQKTFDSWEDYGQNIAIGRWYWRGRKEDGESVQNAVNALLTEEDSPWKTYAWDMPLPSLKRKNVNNSD